MKKSCFILAFTLSGCGSHNWIPGPGKNIDTFQSEKAQCSYIARHGGSGSGFYAQGTQSYVAGAQLGHVISEAVRIQADFNDCMLAKG